MGDARRIAFLFGSGTSKPAGMPLGDEITQRVLSGKDAAWYNDDVYIFGPALGPGKAGPGGFPDAHVWRIVALLKALRTALRVAPQSADAGWPNYEELFDAAVQIHRAVQCRDPDESRWGRLAAHLNCQLRDVLGRRQWDSSDPDLEWLAQEALTYIQCLVPHLLRRHPTRLDHLGWVVKACRDQDLAGVDIFTLNHDMVLETCLANADLGDHVTNGFDARENDLCYWNPGLYEARQMRVRLVKLHGSVNWFVFAPTRGGGSCGTILAMPRAGKQFTWKGRGGEELECVSSRPVLLTGIQTKVNAYANKVFEPLFDLFRGSLYRCNHVLVCGYGFRDSGINRILADWLEAPGDRRMVVIHRKPEQLAHAMSSFGPKGRIKIVEKWVEEVKWPDLKRWI